MTAPSKERLEEIRAFNFDTTKADFLHGIHELFSALDARDAEIERLRAELSTTKLARGQPEHYTVELVEARAEVERLKAERDRLSNELGVYILNLEETENTNTDLRTALTAAEARERGYREALGNLEIKGGCFCGKHGPMDENLHTLYCRKARAALSPTPAEIAERGKTNAKGTQT